MTGYVTKFGSLESFEKGGIEIIDDEPKHYTFSNIFEVASAARPWEKVAVGKNMEYVVEVIRAEGTSELAHARPRRVPAGAWTARSRSSWSSWTSRPCPPTRTARSRLDGEPVGPADGSHRAAAAATWPCSRPTPPTA